MLSALLAIDPGLSMMPTAPLVQTETHPRTISFEELLSATESDGEIARDTDDDPDDTAPVSLSVLPWRTPVDTLSTVAEGEQSAVAAGAAEQDGAAVAPYGGPTPALASARALATDDNATDADTDDLSLHEAGTAQYLAPTPRQPEAHLSVPGLTRPAVTDYIATNAEADDLPLHKAAPRQDGGPTPRQPEAAVSVLDPTRPVATDQFAEASIDEFILHEFRSATPLQQLTRSSASEQARQPMADACLSERDPIASDISEAPAAGAASSRLEEIPEPAVQAQDNAHADHASLSSLTPRSIKGQEPASHAEERDSAVRTLTRSARGLTIAGLARGEEGETTTEPRPSTADAALAPEATEFATPLPVAPAPNMVPNARSVAVEGPPVRHLPNHANHTARPAIPERMQPLETAIVGSIRPAPEAETDSPIQPVTSAPTFGNVERNVYAEPERLPAEPSPLQREAHTTAPPQFRVTVHESTPEVVPAPRTPAAPPSSEITPPPRPVDKITVAVGGGEGQPRAEILLHHKADGAIQMAVRTADVQLAESLRAGLPELNSDLEARGFRSELQADPARENAGDSQEQQHRRPRWFYERNDDD